MKNLVQPVPCKSCPFAGDPKYKVNLSNDAYTGYLQNILDGGQHLCHSCNNQKVCRGARDIQLRFFCFQGLIQNPTDADLAIANQEYLAKENKMYLLLPIHPRHSRNILDGLKTIELRKSFSSKEIQKVLIYETKPTQKIVGYFTPELMEAASARYWSKYHKQEICLSRQEIFDYLKNNTGVGIKCNKVRSLVEPVLLNKMREIGVNPPQKYNFLNYELIDKLGIKIDD